MTKPWNYSITVLPFADRPATHAVFLECTDENGNYRGIEIGRSYRSEAEARHACERDRTERTDWRTATEVDLGIRLRQTA